MPTPASILERTHAAAHLISNALDEVEDARSIGVETKIFKTDRVFNLGAAGVIIILCILYKLLW